MSKPRILFPISFNFQIRYLLRTGFLKKCAMFCDPIIVLFWNQDDLKQELEAIGCKVYQMHYTKEDSLLMQIRNRVDAYYKKNYVKTPTTALRQKHRFALLPLKKKVKYVINKIKLSAYSNADFEKDKQLLSALIQQNHAWKEIIGILSSETIECVFTTAPFLVSEDLVCRAAQNLNIPIYYSVLSFDNPTTRGFMPFIPARIAVWNKQNKEQLIRIWGNTIANEIDITGPPQFDFYFDSNFVTDEKQWHTVKQLPSNRPIIMYGANAKYYIPNEYNIVKLIDDAIENGQIKGYPIILIRPHPTDAFKDWQLFVQTLKHTYIERSIQVNQSEVDMNNKFSNFTLEDVISLCSTLSYTEVHISYASTLALDGICFDKPQICPYFSPSPQILSHQVVRNLYYSEHYVPITQSGAVIMPKNENDLIVSINQALIHPNILRSEREKLKRDYLYNTTGTCTEQLITSFSNYLRSSVL